MLHCVTHWPFCPGVFIAILGFVAVFVTFKVTPETTKREKAFWIILCFALMWCEIWMMSKDRDHYDEIEQSAQLQEKTQAANINIIMLQNGDARVDQAKALASLADLSRNAPLTKDKLLKIEALQLKADDAQKRADDSAKQFAITVLPNTTSKYPLLLMVMKPVNTSLTIALVLRNE